MKECTVEVQPYTFKRRLWKDLPMNTVTVTMDVKAHFPSSSLCTTPILNQVIGSDTVETAVHGTPEAQLRLTWRVLASQLVDPTRPEKAFL